MIVLSVGGIGAPEPNPAVLGVGVGVVSASPKILDGIRDIEPKVGASDFFGFSGLPYRFGFEPVPEDEVL